MAINLTVAPLRSLTELLGSALFVYLHSDKLTPFKRLMSRSPRTHLHGTVVWHNNDPRPKLHLVGFNVFPCRYYLKPGQSTRMVADPLVPLFQNAI